MAVIFELEERKIQLGNTVSEGGFTGEILEVGCLFSSRAFSHHFRVRLGNAFFAVGISGMVSAVGPSVTSVRVDDLAIYYRSWSVAINRLWH
jgi:hypothetical protein